MIYFSATGNKQKKKGLFMKSFRERVKAAAVLAVTGSVFITSFASCGSAGSEASAKSSGGKDDVKTVIVGSGNSYKPYCYLDENGNAVGYEYDILKEIDKLLPQYKFEYQSMTFDNIVLSLDAGKIDLGAHQFEYTDERAQKYLFSKESYTSYTTRIVVPIDNNDITSLDDLAGQKVEAQSSTSATNQILTNYNKEHPDKALDIVNHSNLTDEELTAELKSGAVKATVLIQRRVDGLNKENGEDFIKSVGDPINTSQTYYLFRKDETDLQEAVDGALKTLRENGTLKELSEKWLGGDYTEGE